MVWTTTGLIQACFVPIAHSRHSIIQYGPLAAKNLEIQVLAAILDRSINSRVFQAQIGRADFAGSIHPPDSGPLPMTRTG